MRKLYPSTEIFPYVYLGIHKITSQFYIGYVGSTRRKLPSHSDLGTRYFTSSKKVAELGFENFDWIILAEFFDPITGGLDAYNFEQDLISENWKNPLKLNGRLQRGDKFCTVGREPTNKGKKNSEWMTPEMLERVHSQLSQPKPKSSLEKMVKTRKSNRSYEKENHHLAKTWIFISPEGKSYNVEGDMKGFCVEHNLSWQCLYGNKNAGPILLDRTRHKNLKRMTERFFNTIGWELRNN